MHSKLVDTISTLCSDIVAPLLHKLGVPVSKPDIAKTVPFKHKKFFCFSRLRLRALRQTDRRWSHHENAIKDDEEAGTYQALILSREVSRGSSTATFLLSRAEDET